MYLDLNRSVIHKVRWHRWIWLGLFLGSVASFAFTPSDLKTIQTPQEIEIQNLREKEINQNKVALSRSQADSQRIELYHRLAELYLEAYRANFLLEGRLHQKRISDGRR